MYKKANNNENHQNQVVWVLIWKLSLSTRRWVPICQGFSNFLGILHHFVLAKLATSSIRVKTKMGSLGIQQVEMGQANTHTHTQNYVYMVVAWCGACELGRLYNLWCPVKYTSDIVLAWCLGQHLDAPNILKNHTNGPQFFVINLSISSEYDCIVSNIPMALRRDIMPFLNK